MKKITLVIIGGIRTHYIKINAIQKVISNLSSDLVNKFDITYIDAAQHYDVALTGFVDELNIHFDYRLYHESKDSFQRLSSMFEKLGSILDKISTVKNIDYVITMGDVSTTAIASLVAITKQIKLIHIESGARIGRGNGSEEYFRTAADHLSSICFASTQMDFENLLSEGFKNRACFSGDVIYDYIRLKIKDIDSKYFSYYISNEQNQFSCENPDYILASLHHAENLEGNTLQNLFSAIEQLGIRSIFIAHPRILKIIKNYDINTFSTIIVDRIPYLDNLCAIKNCRYIITDSGGIQREAYYFNKRCVVRSDLTVWRPIIEIGSNITVGKEKQELIDAMQWAEKNQNVTFLYNNCFGDGKAVKTILERILKEEK